MIKNVRPDTKGRIALGKLANGVSSFSVNKLPDGRIILDPNIEIPAREAWLLKNNQAAAQIEKGIQESQAGKVSSLDDFSQFVEV